jgi:asparagine synthase (glutamine-hydrolysing)
VCAIFGIIGKYDLEKVRNALNLMIHRGKDYQKIVEFDKGVFGFNRLAIENVDKNLQPLKIDNKVFVFNGEIYNYKDLIKRYDLNVKTEIEVIAALWEKFNVDFVKKLDGMFAIAIFDKKLYLFRDEFGKKPLYFTKSGIFASEIKAILPFVKKELNFDALAEFLAYNSSIAPNTVYKGIYKLTAGCYYDGEIKRWFDFKRNENQKWTKENVVDEFEKLLIKSIEKRMQGEVEIGSLLSGGVDSSLIAAITSRYKKIKTFSIGYDGYNNYDERKYAKIVANHINSKHYEVNFTKKDFFDEFENTLFYIY